ncbi:YbbR-like domain-containing protein [Aureibaculum sp. A20]|uniref:YbbR-like domain-containing protein n=1 Tax=Aureibaculum flavum TaxID=2795986 RepID=A0ABS0WLB3_9FLAO|nr:YbbR-like domain-containing protein [Aureibaculum flavum]MBJ2172760.1 YbbR-like domain-containing protein [Aureibaculum flavum]
MKVKKYKSSSKIKATKKTKMILGFLVLSFLFWVLIKLSKEYIDVVPVNVEYINLPKGKMLQQEPQKTVQLTLKTFGFDLVKYHLFKRKVTVDLQSIKPKNSSLYYQPSANLLTEIQSQLVSDVEIYSIKPDTLFYNIGQAISKTVPIKTDLEIDYKSGYNLFGNLKIEPDEVTISGPELLVDSILKVVTQKKTLVDVNSNFEFTIPLLQLENNTKVTYSTNEIKVSGVVDKFTEAKFTIPVLVNNLPKNYSINTFPDNVEIIFQVGISDYNKINKNDFKVSCDYERSVKDGLSYLIPKVVLKPSYVSDIRIVPNQIDYLIKND